MYIICRRFIVIFCGRNRRNQFSSYSATFVYKTSVGLLINSIYSEQYFKNIQKNKEKTQQKEIFAELVQQYKKRIWNE